MNRSLAETACVSPPCLMRDWSVWPTAFSFTRARNALTTPISTSASSRLSRTSRRAASMLPSLSSVSPARRLRAWRKPLAIVSNMAISLLARSAAREEVYHGPIAVGRSPSALVGLPLRLGDPGRRRRGQAGVRVQLGLHVVQDLRPFDEEPVGL